MDAPWNFGAPRIGIVRAGPLDTSAGVGDVTVGRVRVAITERFPDGRTRLSAASPS